MALSPIQKQIADLESRVAVLDRVVQLAKTSGGHITNDGKNLIYILRNAGMKKSEIAKVLDVSPAALTKYD